jgi:hypothetical protein
MDIVEEYQGIHIMGPLGDLRNWIHSSKAIGSDSNGDQFGAMAQLGPKVVQV